jgi:hypothetical protein
LRGDEGFGLIEVLVAFVVLMAVALPSSLLLGSVLAQEATNRSSVPAGEIAEQALESAHGVLSAAMTGSCNEVMPCTVALANQVVGGITFHATLNFDWALLGNASADVCNSLIVPQVASATATVKWGPGLHSLSESSVVNLPYTPTNLNDGFLAVQVKGVLNHGTSLSPNFGQQNIKVTVTSDTGAVQTFPVTDRNGCAFATVPANLSSSCPTNVPTCTNYTIAISPPTGSTATYVDQTLNPAPTATITVAPTQVTGPPTFTYDKAAYITMSYPTVTGVEGGVTCPLATLCVAIGQVQNGSATTPKASILSSTGSSWATITPPSGLTELNALACPSTTQCYGVGDSSSDTGMAVSATLSGGVWNFTSLPTPASTELSSITCPSTTQCLATGYTLAGSVRTGVLLSFNGTTWSTVTTSGVTNLTSVVCPTTTACTLVGTNGSTPELYTFVPTVAPAMPTFTPVTLSPAPKTLNAVTCPQSATTCFVTGATSAAATAAWFTANNGSTWASVSSIASGFTVLGTPVCTSSTACLIPANSTGASGANGTVLSLTQTVGPTWTAATPPASFPSSQWISAVSCVSTTCFAAGQSAYAVDSPLPTLAVTSGGGTWTSVSLPGSVTQNALYGVGCGSFGCVAVGESTTSDLLFSYASGSWTSNTDPSTGSGLVGLGFSASVSNTLLAGTVRQVATATPGVNPTALGTPLYPFASGYSVFPGSCAAESSQPLTTVAPGPGGTATAEAQLANVEFEIVDANGQPEPNTTVTATAATTGSMLTCAPDVVALPTTGSAGVSGAGFSLGTYKLTVSGLAVSGSVIITNNGITYNGVTYPDPSVVPVVLP